MNVALSRDLEELIETKVSNGGYRSPSEVISDALRLLEERDRFVKTRWNELRLEISRGLEQLDNGDKSILEMSEIKSKARELRILRDWTRLTAS